MRAELRKFHYIYKVVCQVTNRYYIGMHSTDNIEDGYFGSGTRLARSKRKYGLEQHKLEILEFLPDRVALRAREAELVNETTLADKMCMNIILGGGDIRLTPDQLRARSKAIHKTRSLKAKIDPSFRQQLQTALKANRAQAWLVNRDHMLETTTKGLAALGSPEVNAKRKNTFELIKHQSGAKNSQFGTCWVTDGTSSKSIKKEDLHTWEVKGWRRGRTLSIA